MGFLIKATMRKAPPFYYYHDFSKDAEESILDAITKPAIYAASLDEYKYAHDDAFVHALKAKNDFPDIPLVLITHASAFSEQEIVQFGRTTVAFAKKVEEMWQLFMQEYLSFSANAVHLQADHSGHFLHLTEPELIDKALALVTK